MAADRVRAMCAHFHQPQEIVDFVAAITHLLFRSGGGEWPSGAAMASATASVYRRLFADSLLARFRALIDEKLCELERALLEKIVTINCTPMPLFQKRTVKFDALLASGISHELKELVHILTFSGLSLVYSSPFVAHYSNYSRRFHTFYRIPNSNMCKNH